MEGKREIFADRVMFNLAASVNQVSRIASTIFSLFPILFLAGRKLGFDFVNRAFEWVRRIFSGDISYEQFLLLTCSPFLLMAILVLSLKPVRFIRSKWLYPKSSFDKRAMLPIEARTFKNRLGENFHFLTVNHPAATDQLHSGSIKAITFS
jgi:hypothetical protein